MRTGVLHLTSFLRPEVFSYLSKTLVAADVADGLALAPTGTGSAVGDGDGFVEKEYPPAYDVGVTSFRGDDVAAAVAGTRATSSSTSPSTSSLAGGVGTWRVAGPPFKQRVCVFEPRPPAAISSPPAAPSAPATAVGEAAEAGAAAAGSGSAAVAAGAAFEGAAPSVRAGWAMHALSKHLFQSAAFARLLQWLTSKVWPLPSTALPLYYPYSLLLPVPDIKFGLSIALPRLFALSIARLPDLSDPGHGSAALQARA